LSVFDLNTGKPQNPPAEESLKTYNVKIDNNEVYVEV
jgi:nitrite reductase/ring-hydroxylating ferredoxin subunit